MLRRLLHALGLKKPDPLSAYRLAEDRFITQPIEIDGVAHVRKIDPATGVWVSLPPDHRERLSGAFKAEWLRRVHGRNGCG